ncbi:multidrug transporter subunit MdtD [Escherichia coli]|uniref:Putative multidrug resistance protein MdtD n=1 Tax=Escherichia coli TaxID=562 RepID=A0A484X0Q1_ECOLX|nr:multidrug transporter subunit MdtD [Escherichia coli]AYO70839.1 MFS transporter [Escherichia coli DSM 30083 = JCM 1649 = ATCC 11775]EEV7014679.1 MFS transporter [Escherichia coli]EEW5319990.1 MFS transporter [Escherichia coli]EFG1233287.1 MFS transporter [Escherichia coli]EFG4547893.1 MFS transporter [Escherichia coli]
MTDLPDSTRWQLWIVAFGFFMQSLDTTIVNTALPSMAQSLGESPLHMHMVIVSYVLTVAVMLPASGWLADKVGVRNIFFTAIVLFTLGSLFCALSGTLNELLLARALQGVGGAMMVPVGRLTVMKIVPREQYMAAMTFVTLPGQVGPLLGPALGGLLVEYASWHWIFLINIPVGIIGAIATLMLMPNYTMQTRRFDLSGFLLLAVGMAVLTLALDGSKGTGFSPLAIAGLVAVGVVALVLYLLHAQNNNRALFSLKLFRTRTFSLGLSLVTLLFMTTALLGWYYVLPFVLFLQGMVNSTRFSSMNTLTLKDLPDNLASSGNSLLSMIMQLSMSIGVTIAGLLLGLFGSQHVSVDSGTTQTVFMYTWLSMAFIIALPAFVFARVPSDTHQNVAISRRKRSAQ